MQCIGWPFSIELVFPFLVWGVSVYAQPMRYRGVSRFFVKNRRKGWLAQSRVVGVYRARFRTARAAATWLADQLQINVDSLAMPAARRGRKDVPSHHAPMSRFNGVCYHENRGRPRWEVRELNVPIFTSRSERAAAAFLGRRRKVEVQKLKKAQPLSKRLAKEIFKANYRAFRAYVPGDYTSMVKHETKTSRAMYKQDS